MTVPDVPEGDGDELPRSPFPLPAAHAADRFGVVLTLLSASFLAPALLPGRGARAVSLLLYTAALLVALRSARTHLPGSTVLRRGLLVGSAGALALGLLSDGAVVRAVAAAWVAAVTASAAVLVVRSVLTHRVVTLQSVLGALSAYLLIGFCFAALFLLTSDLSAVAFFAGGPPGEAIGSFDAEYFSFVTLTTTGYGDLTAATRPGRALAVLEALTGQIFLVTMVARLVSLFGAERRAGGPRHGRSGPRRPAD